MILNPKVWLPYYSFFLTTIAVEYPDTANEVTRKKYYELIQNCNTYDIIFDKKNNFYNLCKGLSNHTIRLTNEELNNKVIGKYLITSG